MPANATNAQYAASANHAQSASEALVSNNALSLGGTAAAKFLYHVGTYTSGRVTVSTSSPSGGADGDVWLKV